MKIKIGDTWYENTPSTPIMLVFDEKDKQNMQNMCLFTNKYVIIHSETNMKPEEQYFWMND
jgi:hypothetical protein